MKRIAIISNTLLDIDGRVQRQIDGLAKDFEVHIFMPVKSIALITELENKKVTIHNITQRKNPIRTMIWLVSIVFGIKKISFLTFPFGEPRKTLHTYKKSQIKFDYIVVNDIYLSPIALEMKKGNNAKLIIDAHEYYLNDGAKTILSKFARKYKIWACDYAIPKCNLFITVSQDILELYKRRYSFENTMIMYNAPYSAELSNHSLKPDKIILENHGIAMKIRKLETVIDSMKYLNDNYILKMYLVGSQDSIDYYEKYIKDNSYKNIYLCKPVDPKEIVSTVSSCDIGVCYIPSISTNYELCMPNKLFESIVAGNPVVVTPNKCMGRFVNEYNVGVVANDYSAEAFAKAIEECVSRYYELKNNVMSIRETFSYEHQVKQLISFINDEMEKGE